MDFLVAGEKLHDVFVPEEGGEGGGVGGSTGSREGVGGIISGVRV